ncbi:il18r1 [Pungitius sinensis]
MVALYCPQDSGSSHDDAKVIWISSTTHETTLTDTSPAEQRKMGLLIHGRSLVILSASLNHQGNYLCSLGNASRPFWFRLIVLTTQSKEYQKRTQYSQICYTQEGCTLNCPDVNVPSASITNITSKGITWHKEVESFPRDDHFSSVEVNDQGEYSCTRSYLYYGKIYRMTFTLLLRVKPKGKSGRSMILSPQISGVLNVDLGATVVVDCEAVMYSDFDEVFWLEGGREVETNNSFPVFYNHTRESNATVIKMTASLVFKNVAEKHLSKYYTCRLESVSGPPSFITITLARKASLSSLSLALIIAAVMVAIVVTSVVLVKLKIDITLFPTICCHHNPSDEKSYDAFRMSLRS